MAEMGRPKHYSTKDIMNVIDMYVSFTGGTVLLNSSKIAEYARTKLGLIYFKYYVINRNSEAKEYLKDINEAISSNSEKQLTSAVTTFTQINIQSYQSMTKEQLGRALANLNTLMEDMADSNTKLLKQSLALKELVREKDIELKRFEELYNQMSQNSDENMEGLKNKVNEQREIINKLTQSVKQSDDVVHLLWDKEAEVVMKYSGVFENDEEEIINSKRIMTDIQESISHVTKDAHKIHSSKDSEKISKRFMERLNNL
ncbi:hypothetical protein [Desulfosporosinus sp. FKA]|uniref:hypothetical protein n=1 Tax=Desulfosporosinus sp. FKA TaxID=1969834 RepID=UPI000B49DAE5|nr:hypothetical protein [Desulfosporosinus sp. FKA]